MSDAGGLGRGSGGGPDFAPPAPPSSPPPAPAVATPARRRPGPVRRPALVLAAAVLLVAAAATVATLAADRPGPPAPTPAAPASPVSAAGPSILFTGARGTGRLTVLLRTWDADRPQHLRLRVELACTTGAVDLGPRSLSLVDTTGAVLRPAPAAGGLARGTLGPGERVRGEVVFELPEQAVTLVLADRAGSVTALRLPG